MDPNGRSEEVARVGDGIDGPGTLWVGLGWVGLEPHRSPTGVLLEPHFWHTVGRGGVGLESHVGPAHFL